MSKKPISSLTVTVDTRALRLVARALEALVSADLGESCEDACCRLLALAKRGSTVESDPATKATVRMVWKPFAELALLDVIAIAQSTSSAETKASRIRSALALGGY